MQECAGCLQGVTNSLRSGGGGVLSSFFSGFLELNIVLLGQSGLLFLVLSLETVGKFSELFLLFLELLQVCLDLWLLLDLDFLIRIDLLLLDKVIEGGLREFSDGGLGLCNGI